MGIAGKADSRLRASLRAYMGALGKLGFAVLGGAVLAVAQLVLNQLGMARLPNSVVCLLVLALLLWAPFFAYHRLRISIPLEAHKQAEEILNAIDFKAGAAIRKVPAATLLLAEKDRLFRELADARTEIKELHAQCKIGDEQQRAKEIELLETETRLSDAEHSRDHWKWQYAIATEAPSIESRIERLARRSLAIDGKPVDYKVAFSAVCKNLMTGANENDIAVLLKCWDVGSDPKDGSPGGVEVSGVSEFLAECTLLDFVEMRDGHEWKTLWLKPDGQRAGQILTAPPTYCNSAADERPLNPA